MNDEFKFEEDIGDTPKRTKASKKFSTIISILVALFFGITVFILVSLLINRSTPKEIPIKELDIEDEVIENLYEKISYNQLGYKDPIFIQKKSLDVDSMTNQDKYLLALNLVKEKDIVDSNIVEDNKKIYYITPDIIRDYMKEIFGTEVKYTRDTTIENYIFPFEKDNLNTANIEYNQTSARYELVFTSLSKEKEDIPTNKTYYKELVKAEEKENNLVLTENIVYVKCLNEQEKETYKCDIYEDFDKTIKLEEKENIDISGIKLNTLKETNTIKYTFNKTDEGEYIFKSSKIEK